MVNVFGAKSFLFLVAVLGLRRREGGGFRALNAHEKCPKRKAGDFGIVTKSWIA